MPRSPALSASLVPRALALACGLVAAPVFADDAREEPAPEPPPATSEESSTPGALTPLQTPSESPSTATTTTATETPPRDDSFISFTRHGARLDVALDFLTRLVFDATDPSTFEPPQLNILPMPDLGYNPDEGINTGLVVPIVWNEPGVFPYKYSFGVSLLMSTKLVQNHMFLFDIVRAFNLPLRFTGRTGLYAFELEPYCGIGNQAACHPEAAAARADYLSLDGPQRQKFLGHFDTMRIVRPYFAVLARYELFELLGKWEAFVGWRSEMYIPGFFTDPFTRDDMLNDPIFDSGPHANSLFADDFPDGQPGYVNIPQVGLMLDTRDSELSPREGYWLEASVRGAHEWLLSSWSFAGANATARFYAPLDNAKTVVFAQRYALDAIIGDAPVQELARFGSSIDYRGFGGKAVGRGMRQQTRIGDFKLASQHELRWDAINIAVGAFSIGFELVGFLDAGVVMHQGIDYVSTPLVPKRLPLVQVTGGSGLRLVINKTIIIRFDLGFSPAERYAPLFYVDGGHVF